MDVLERLEAAARQEAMILDELDGCLGWWQGRGGSASAGDPEARSKAAPKQEGKARSAAKAATAAYLASQGPRGADALELVVAPGITSIRSPWEIMATYVESENMESILNLIVWIMLFMVVAASAVTLSKAIFKCLRCSFRCQCSAAAVAGGGAPGALPDQPQWPRMRLYVDHKGMQMWHEPPQPEDGQVAGPRAEPKRTALPKPPPRGFRGEYVPFKAPSPAVPPQPEVRQSGSGGTAPRPLWVEHVGVQTDPPAEAPELPAPAAVADATADGGAGWRRQGRQGRQEGQGGGGPAGLH